MKKHTFIFGAVILTIGGFVAKIIGAFYKIPLTNILGSAGMGIYYLVFPIYNLILVVSSSGVSVAITKLIAESRTRKMKKNESKYFYAGILISFLFSLSFAVVILIFAKPLAYFQGNILSYLSFLAIVPAIISASMVSVIRAYFQGVENMLPSTITIIFEQIVKLIAGLILSFKLLPYGIEYAVMGAVLAVSISETMTLIILIVNYVWHKKRNERVRWVETCCHKTKVIKHTNKIVKKPSIIYKTISTRYLINYQTISFKAAIVKTFKTSFPNTLMSLIIPLASLIDSFLIINLLSKSGYSSFAATSLYGINNGVVTSLISLPVIITSAIATAIVPNLSGLFSMKRSDEIEARSSFFIKITWLIILPIFIFFITMSDGIISALYNFNINKVINEYAFACKILMISSVSFVYNALLSTFISILQAINKSYQVFCVLLSGLFIKVLLTISLLQIVKFNIFGAIIANIVFVLYSAVMCLAVLRKNINIKLNVIKSFLLPSFVAVIVFSLMMILKNILKFLNVWLVLGVNGIVCIVTYCVLIVALNCFDKNDIRYMPFLSAIMINKKRIND